MKQIKSLLLLGAILLLVIGSFETASACDDQTSYDANPNPTAKDYVSQDRRFDSRLRCIQQGIRRVAARITRLKVTIEKRGLSENADVQQYLGYAEYTLLTGPYSLEARLATPLRNAQFAKDSFEKGNLYSAFWYMWTANYNLDSTAFQLDSNGGKINYLIDAEALVAELLSSGV